MADKLVVEQNTAQFNGKQASHINTPSAAQYRGECFYKQLKRQANTCLQSDVANTPPETLRCFNITLLPLQVHIPNNCEFGTRGDMEEAEFDDLFVKDPEELKKDPHTCFFENQYHAHGSRWIPSYDKCFSCSCQVKTK